MTAIITKNGTGVPPGEALQKGELAVDLDGLKLYTSTNGTDVVEVSPAPEVTDGAWSANDGYIQIADEPNGGYAVTWSYDDGEENYLWCFEVDCKEVGGEIGYFSEFGSDKVEIGTAPAGFSASKEKFVAKRADRGIAVPMAEGDTLWSFTARSKPTTL